MKYPKNMLASDFYFLFYLFFSLFIVFFYLIFDWYIKHENYTYLWSILFVHYRYTLHIQVKHVCLKHYFSWVKILKAVCSTLLRMQFITIFWGHFPKWQNTRLCLLDCNLNPIGKSFPSLPLPYSPQPLLTTSKSNSVYSTGESHNEIFGCKMADFESF